MNRESRVLDITAGNKLDSLQNGLEACLQCDGAASIQSEVTRCMRGEIFSSWFPSPFHLNLILTPTARGRTTSIPTATFLSLQF